MDPSLEGLAAAYLYNNSDPTRLSSREIKQSWGSFTNFMASYGLKAYNPEDCEEALAISRALKEGDLEAEQEERDSDDESSEESDHSSERDSSYGSEDYDDEREFSDSDLEEMFGSGSDGLEGLAASYLWDESDSTRLSRKEVKQSWGSYTNFMLSYGLKPYNPEDCDEALQILRGMREIDLARAEYESEQKKEITTNLKIE